MASASSTLRVPGQPATPPTTPRHRISRTPPGKRGRPRKAPPPPPPPRLKDRVRAVRRSPWFVPGALAAAVALLGLFYSAIRIAARQSSAEWRVTAGDGPWPPAPGAHSPVSVKENGRIEILTNEPNERANQPKHVPFAPKQAVKHAGQAMDDAVRHALEEAWHLPEHGHVRRDAGETAQAVEGATGLAGAEGGAQAAPKTQRTLAELYADLEELGISASELQEALDEGLREAGER